MADHRTNAHGRGTRVCRSRATRRRTGRAKLSNRAGATRRRQRSTRPRRWSGLAPYVLVGGLVWGLWFAAEVGRQLPASDEIGALGSMANATVIYDAFDQPAFTLFRERRLSVPLDDISPHLTGAVLAVEDRRFYDHPGFDLVRIGGAVVADVRAGRLAQGGSTITQQLARVSLLSRERTFRRKVAEVITAVRIERAYAKDRILEFYLNKVYLGDGFYGVEAASQGYFGKPAAELTLAEAALLAGLIRAPSTYSPADHPDEALARREVALTAMLDAGVADSEEVARAREEPLRLRNGLEAPPEFGGYFEAEVRRRLVDRFGADTVYGEGLRVYTTLVPELQRAAEDATVAGLRRIESLPRFPHAQNEADSRLQAALIALDPRTGAVRAVVGGRRFAESAFNRATQARRQPGSAFKPFLYAAALDNGLTPATWLADLDRPMPTVQGDWLPHDEADGSAMTLRTALRLSSNRAAVRLLELTGIDRTVDYADRFGLGPQPPVPSVALGSGTVTLESLTAAYAAFANQGVVPQPMYIRRVERTNGTTVFSHDNAQASSGRTAVGPATAFVVASLLRDVIDAGTGIRVRREGFLAPAGGKTGTTNEYKDAWFVGFTPELAAGVWIGFDQPQTIIPNGYASDLAAPPWAQFMKTALADRPTGWLEQPADVVAVEVCALSGALVRDGCRRTESHELEAIRAGRPTHLEYFVKGTEPVERCPIHEGRNLLNTFARLFGRGDRDSDAREPAAPAPIPLSLPDGQVVIVSHDHLLGSCRGRLVADDDGVRFQTTHRDAFAVAYQDIELFELDPGRRTLRIRPRGRRRYNFTPDAGADGALPAFHAAVLQLRASLVAPASE